MIIEASAPLKYRWPEGEIALKPGQQAEMPELRALRLLAKAGGKVRIIQAEPSIPQFPDMWVTWTSPLFGRCSGQMAMKPENGWIVVRSHSVTGDLALINLDWNVRFHLEPPSDRISAHGK